MMDSSPVNDVLVCGAGTMGAGIAQAAITSGLAAFLYDTRQDALQHAGEQIGRFLGRAVEKGRLTAGEKKKALGRLHLCSDYKTIRPRVVIEAIVEDEAAKIGLFRRLAECFSEETILATNTSSLSVARIATAVPRSERVIGMHFFNPAPLMQLVEIVKTIHTDVQVSETVMLLAKQMGKTPVSVQDAPGFIVNRVARHFYLEAFRLAEDGMASYTAIDRLMEGIGFKLGPFALTDLIGQDVNFSVTRSLYNAFHQEPRFRPARMQEVMVQAGLLGRKTGKGFYDTKK